MRSIVVYQCIRCGKSHEEFDDARFCCATARPIFKCGDCRSVYLRLTEAAKCCAETPPQGEKC